MQLGIFAKTFPATDPAASLAAVREAGYICTQFNMRCAGLAELPDEIPDAVLDRIAAAARASGVTLAALSGTYNMIHPDPAVRMRGMQRLGIMLAAASALGVPLVTLCTGTRDLDDQWRAHPDNATSEAWADLRRAMEEAVRLAEQHGVTLGMEPEQANVVVSAEDALRLIGEIGSPCLRVVLDPANLFEHADRPAAAQIVAHAVEMLAGHIALVHAKDRRSDGAFATAGTGVMDFPDFLSHLRATGFDGPVIAHGLSAAEAPGGAGVLDACRMSVTVLRRDDAALRMHDEGHGAPVVFQHGLGGDAAQVAEIFPADAPLRRLTLECRGHGESTPGSRRPFTIGGFAEDVLAACDTRGVTRCVVGGLSMGAAIALHLAVHHRTRVTALILGRPAWLFDPVPPTMQPYVEVAECLRRFGPADGRARFAGAPTAAMLAREAPDNFASLLGFFNRCDPPTTADLLADIAADGPGVARAQAQSLDLPTLVIGHARDYVHPLATARDLAAAIPGARLIEITPKMQDRERYAAEFRVAIADFVRALPVPQEQPA